MARGRGRRRCTWSAGSGTSTSRFPIPDGTRKVGSYTEMDIQGQYTGWKSLTLTGGIRNLFDRMPAARNQNLSDNTYTQQGFAELYNVRGRFYYVSANYKFF